MAVANKHLMDELYSFTTCDVLITDLETGIELYSGTLKSHAINKSSNKTGIKAGIGGITWVELEDSNEFTIEIVDSKKEIGIMRSIGLSGFKVSLIFVIQMFFVNLLAYGASIPLAKLAIDNYGSNITDPLERVKLSLYTMTYRSPLYLGLFVLIITIIATFVPLIKIMSQKIINVINEREE